MADILRGDSCGGSRSNESQDTRTYVPPTFAEAIDVSEEIRERRADVGRSIPYRAVCQDGVSNTFSIVPDALGKSPLERVDNLVSILDGYFAQGAHHLNVNVMNRRVLTDAMAHPEEYPTLTIRVSGYAVN